MSQHTDSDATTGSHPMTHTDADNLTDAARHTPGKWSISGSKFGDMSTNVDADEMNEAEPYHVTKARRGVMREVRYAAKSLAVRGLRGRAGDPLPDGMSAAAVGMINRDVRGFGLLVTKYQLEILDANNKALGKE